MRKRFVIKASVIFLAATSVIGCSGGSAPLQSSQTQRAQAQRSLDTFADQGYGLTANPHFNTRCITPALTARDRAAGIVVCTAGNLPRGTRLYASDFIMVRDGNHLTIPSPTEIVSKDASDTVVLLDAQGQIVQTFSRSAVITVQKDGSVEAVLPGEPLPMKYQHATAFKVIK